MLAAPPELNTLLGRLPATPNMLFMHDLALLAEARGRGVSHGASPVGFHTEDAEVGKATECHGETAKCRVVPLTSSAALGGFIFLRGPLCETYWVPEKHGRRALTLSR
jgi:hypothetical protein